MPPRMTSFRRGSRLIADSIISGMPCVALGLSACQIGKVVIKSMPLSAAKSESALSTVAAGAQESGESDEEISKCILAARDVV